MVDVRAVASEKLLPVANGGTRDQRPPYQRPYDLTLVGQRELCRRDRFGRRGSVSALLPATSCFDPFGSNEIGEPALNGAPREAGRCLDLLDGRPSDITMYAE